MERMIEICCGSYYDALQAYKGGAKRVELNSALHLGGLTPSVAALRLTKENTDVKVITMVRPRGAGFCYNEEDFAAMVMDTEVMLENGADGIAFGCLDEAGNIHIEQTKKIIDIIKKAGGEVVFHRAFDCTSDPYKAMETLIALGVDRVLTSGLKPKAMQGKDLIKELQEKYGDKIELLAGSGMNAGNAKEMMDYTGIYQVHSSCKDWLHDSTTSLGDVSYSYAEGEHADDYDVVSKELVEKLVSSI
ncbi:MULTISPECIES: copper homeostasis protein CutC [Bacillota]|jgi:copper homeostasis protein|nr:MULTISPECIES: copper homeostasis protein CutC [Erysipelotrichaceae]MCH4287426.1 copper homeostasis protein CutC [Amedibacillus hominis]RGB48510.1 copper homeostasis protein CutC [Absiella sp. AM22-9]RGB52196.1 copper homeostasis protein CutC [Absiella sp. AM10-20]RGB62037.1 copper homeostasis protein CutC [Absiella sp. AM09-45]RGB71162.1 copper homeostasis protein CutC [Absiella sp. AM09-50]